MAANVGQIVYRVVDAYNPGSRYSTPGCNIYSNIVSQLNHKAFTKVGIQAPPGTQVVLSQSKKEQETDRDQSRTIIIGRTGIYELDDDIQIASLYFVRPKIYEKDVELSKSMLENGQTDILAAEKERKERVAAITDDEGKITDYEAYNQIEEEYEVKYEKALSEYYQGYNGIYKANPTQGDLYDVIVDFIYYDE